MMMTVNRRAASFSTDTVKLVAESSHIGGAVFIACNDLVNRVDDDCVQMLIAYTTDQLWHKLIQRNSVPAQVPDDDVINMLTVITERIVYLDKTVHTGGGINLQIDIQYSSFTAGKSQPGFSFCNRRAKLHEQEGFPSLTAA